MSNVYAKDRNLAKEEFFKVAVAIRILTIRLMGKDSIVPKSYRFLLATPIAETARELVHNIERAWAFYPNTPRGVLQRKHYLTLAMANCNQLGQDIQTIKGVVGSVSMKRFNRLTDLIDREIELVKAKKNNVKLVGKITKEQRLEALEREIAELRAALG